MTQLVQNVPEEKSDDLQWQSPAGEISITVEAEIVERLRHDVLTAFRALPKRGMEVGGILLGRVHSSHPRAITVEQAETISCEHQSGPAFILSESDRTQLAHQLTKLREDGQVVLGYYRSCTGREVGLDVADVKIIDELWPGSDDVFLVIQPVSMHECVAAFLFRRDGKLQTKPDHAPFPFRIGPAPVEIAEVSSQEEPSHPEQERESVTTESVEPIALPTFTEDAQPFRRRRLEEAQPRRRTWPWVVGCIALAVAILATSDVWISLAEPQWSQLGLNVSPTESGLEVSWDASIPEVRNARWGVLTIEDKNSESEIELNRAALARGTFTYRTAGNDILVRFRVAGTHTRVFGETVRFVGESSKKLVPPAGVTTAGAVAPQAEENGLPPDSTEVAPPHQRSNAEAQSDATASQATNPLPTRPPEENTNLRIAFPARAVHESQPAVPEGIRSRIQERIVVPVTVRISASGQVVSATPEGDGDTVYRYLASRAAQAAKLWRFDPARTAKRTPSASTKTLHFVFTP